MSIYILMEERFDQIQKRLDQKLDKFERILVQQMGGGNSTQEQPLDSSTVMRLYNISSHTLTAWKKAGLVHIRVNRKVFLFWKSDIDAFLENRKIKINKEGGNNG